MSEKAGKVIVICGSGKGKTNAAIGRGVRALAEGRTVTVIQFLKGRASKGLMRVLKKLEPEMKAFSFEQYEGKFLDLGEEEKKEELDNIRNGINFARKVLSTDSCDMLILDEILGLVDLGILSAGELCEMVRKKPEDMELVITGKVFPEELRPLADSVSYIESV